MLVLTSVVAEGLELAFAKLWVHYDAPWSPTALAKRLAHVDRVGAPPGPVRHVLFADGIVMRVPLVEKLFSIRDAGIREDAEVLSDILGSPSEPIEPDLLAALRHAISLGTTLPTLSLGKPNFVVDITEGGVWVETENSRAAGKGPGLVAGWMLNLAWRHLQDDGWVTNQHLLADHNVRRSSAVTALLAALPEVEVESSRPIVLRLRP